MSVKLVDAGTWRVVLVSSKQGQMTNNIYICIYIYIYIYIYTLVILLKAHTSYEKC